MITKRHLRPAELKLIEFLLALAPESKTLASNLSLRLVEEMSDGGMGSLRFSAIMLIAITVGPLPRQNLTIVMGCWFPSRFMWIKQAIFMNSTFGRSTSRP